MQSAEGLQIRRYLEQFTKPRSYIKYEPCPADSATVCTLPSGEKYQQSHSTDSRPFQQFTSFSQELRLRANALYYPEEYRTAIRDTLNGMTNCNPAVNKIITEQLLRGDDRIDALIPHWLYIALSARMQFGDRFIVSPPQYASYQPSEYERQEHGISDEEYKEFCRSAVPTLTETAVPLTGSYDDEYDYLWEEITLLRARSGAIAHGQLSFPGGKSDDLLEITAWHELLEEAPQLKEIGINISSVLSDATLLKTQFLSVADQVLIDSKGKLRKFRTYVFTFSFLGHDFMINRVYNPADYPSRIQGVDGDGGGAWRVVQLTKDITLSGVAYDDLSPIAQIAIDALQKRGLGVLKSQRRK